MEVKFKKLLYIIFILVNITRLSANTGKITGQVTDEEDGSPIIGANVIVQGTQRGAATNEDGYFSILNVSPGTYDVKVSMMGYQNVVVEDVEVQIDLNTTVNVEMGSEELEMSEVTVQAERPVIKKDVSGSEMNMSTDKIENLPVTGVEDVISLQAGVEEGLEIRGGSARQTKFIVDGFTQNDARSNNPFYSMNLNSVQEIKVQTGGFNAEYGQSRSGVVNVVTKSGNRDSYHGSVSFKYSPPDKKNFGISPYSEDSYFLKPYLDPEVCYVGTNEGPWSQHKQNQYPTFEGWNFIARSRNTDNDPTNDLTPEGAKRLFEYQHRRDGKIDEMDYVADFGLGGPVPGVSEYLGDLRFYASLRDLQEMFIVPLSRESYDNRVGRIKFTSNITSNTELVINGRYGEVESTSPYNWTTTPTGDVFRSNYSIASDINSEMLFVPAYYSPSDIYRTVVGGKLRHMINDGTYFEIKLQHNINNYNTFKMEERDTTDNYDIFPGSGEFLVDENPYGYWGYSVQSIGDNIDLGGWQNLGRDKSTITTTELEFDYVSQVNNRHQVKTGGQIEFNNYDINSYTSNPSMETWNREQKYNVEPYSVGAYAQDKLEFEGFIANVGLRLDYTDPNTKYYDIDKYSEYLSADKGEVIEEEAPKKEAEAKWSLNPRLGISHPVTEYSKLYFNYGHFTTKPASTYRFRIQRYYDNSVTSLGNTNLDQEKTISYEVGYSHSLFDQYMLKIAGYYKDVTNQIAWVEYESIDGSVKYSRPKNHEYEDIRGFELSLYKNTGKWVTGFINYTYMVNTLGHFGYQEYYQDPNKMRSYIKQNPYQERPSPRPYVRANIAFRTPEEYGPTIMNEEMYPLGNWNINLLANWKAGEHETYNPNNILGPGVINNVQWKDDYNIDMRISKMFNTENLKFQIFAEVSNLLNLKQMSDAGFSGSRDYNNYMESLHLDWKEGCKKGDDRVGKYRDWDTEFIDMRNVEDIEAVSNPEKQVVYYDMNEEQYYMVESESGNIQKRDDSWVQNNVIDKNAYIDMPNIRSMTFLNPRSIELGIKIMF